MILLSGGTRMLTAELNMLIDVLGAADHDPPPDLAAALDALPPAGALAAPRAAGALHQVDEEEFELCGRVTRRADAIGGFLDAWEDATPLARVWLAALVGDWPAAHDAAVAVGEPALVRVTGPRAEACR